MSPTLLGLILSFDNNSHILVGYTSQAPLENANQALNSKLKNE